MNNFDHQSNGSPLSNELSPIEHVGDPSNQLDEQQQPNWLRRNMFKLSAGAFLGGTAITLATNPLAEIESDVVQAAPWAAAGIVLTESLWVGGAAVMAAAAGKKIGNPFKLRSRWNDISNDVVSNKAFQAGLAINTTGAIGTAGVVVAGVTTSLPVETWPGGIGIAAADILGTIAIRGGLFSEVRKSRKSENSHEKLSKKVKVRQAEIDDIDRLADIDLLLFDKAYGQEKPDKQEVVDMLTKRFENNPGWMFVAEMDGEIEGFVTAFKTSKPLEEFVSWEDSTANGTLDGKVDSNGSFVYVANMTIKHEAVVNGAEEMLLANLFANSIRDGVEYGYFISRMPYFRRWLEADMSPEELKSLDADDELKLALDYSNLRDEDGKLIDKQLKMYEGLGYSLVRTVANGSEDDASLNFGVLCRANIPPANEHLKKIRLVRIMMAGALRQIAKKPKILQKVF